MNFAMNMYISRNFIPLGNGYNKGFGMRVNNINYKYAGHYCCAIMLYPSFFNDSESKFAVDYACVEIKYQRKYCFHMRLILCHNFSNL